MLVALQLYKMNASVIYESLHTRSPGWELSQIRIKESDLLFSRSAVLLIAKLSTMQMFKDSCHEFNSLITT